jgi:iron complex outermembrane receptor protein
MTSRLLAILPGLRRCLLALGLLLAPPAAFAADKPAAFNVPAGDAAVTLKQFAEQSGQAVVYMVDAVRGVKTNAVKGSLAPREALEQLLAGSNLHAVADEKTGALSVTANGKNGDRAAQTDSDRPTSQGKVEDGRLVLDKFEVFGSKSINLDLPRTRDDVQPYVVFDNAQIRNSQATNLGDFFRTRLPMATPNGPTSAVAFTPLGPTVTSSINLRGLGSNQTLILVDGRPMPGGSAGGANTSQTDINGIPLSMIERVEILPSTASGIYGGGATGGVINIITRKDFSGAVLTLNYVNTFDTDSAQRRADLTASTSLRGGATVLTFTASFGEANNILVADRDFAQRGRDLAFANNPAVYTTSARVPRGYTTNIRNPSGANLVLKPQYGGTTLSSAITFVPVGYAGISSDNAAALVANAGRYNLTIPNDTFGAQSQLLALDSPLRSLGFSVRQKITPWLEGYADYGLSSHQGTSWNLAGTQGSATIAANAPNNPFTTAISVGFPLPGVVGVSTSKFQYTRISSGLVAKLPGGWQAALDYTWGRVRVRQYYASTRLGDPDETGPGISATAAFANGALDVLRDINARPLDYTPYRMSPAVSSYEISDYSGITQSATARASGPVFRLPAGDIVVSGSADWTDDRNPESFLRSDGTSNTLLTYTLSPETSVTKRSAYAEMRVPVLAPRAGMTQPLLELQVAGRYDASRAHTYLDTVLPTAQGANGPYTPVTYLTRNFSATSYTAGLRFAPLPDFTLRASAGTGFLAPARSQMNAGIPVPNFTPVVIDPKRGGISGSIVIPDYKVGGNPNLRPELSESISAGAIFTPRFVPGFRLSVDYTKIDKTDEITSLLPQLAFFYEDSLPGVITRAPLTPADQALGYTGGVVTAMDIRSVNFAQRKVEAVDLQADYTRKVELGEFHFYGVATWNRTFLARVAPGSVPVESVGFYNGPLKWSGNGGIDWRRGPWSAGWNVHYYGEQLIYASTATAPAVATAVLNQGSDHFPAQFYHDLQVAYQFGRNGTGWRKIFSDLRLSVGVQNLFNTEPPLSALSPTAINGGFQPSEDPRLRRYSLNLQKRF